MSAVGSSARLIGAVLLACALTALAACSSDSGNDAGAAVRSREQAVPVTVATHSIEEALARAVEGSGNKGHEAAVAAIEMAEVVAQLTRQATPRT